MLNRPLHLCISSSTYSAAIEAQDFSRHTGIYPPWVHVEEEPCPETGHPAGVNDFDTLVIDAKSNDRYGEYRDRPCDTEFMIEIYGHYLRPENERWVEKLKLVKFDGHSESGNKNSKGECDFSFMEALFAGPQRSASMRQAVLWMLYEHRDALGRVWSDTAQH